MARQATAQRGNRPAGIHAPARGPEEPGSRNPETAQPGQPLPGLGPTPTMSQDPDHGRPIWIGTRRYGPY
jgi:hypothetical protein